MIKEQSSRASSGRGQSRRSGSSGQITRSQEETKQAYGKIIKSKTAHPTNRVNQTEQSQTSATFGIDESQEQSIAQTLQNTQMQSRIIHEDQRHRISSNFSISTGSQRTLQAHEIGNIDKNNSNFSFTGGQKLPNKSRQVPGIIQQTGPNRRAPTAQSLSPGISPQSQSHNFRTLESLSKSGGQVGVSESSAERKETTSFRERRQTRDPSPSIEKQSYREELNLMPCQVKIQPPKENSNQPLNQNQGGQIELRNPLANPVPAHHEPSRSRQNDAIANMLKERKLSKPTVQTDHTSKSRLPGQIDNFSNSGGNGMSNLMSYVPGTHANTGSQPSQFGSFSRENANLPVNQYMNSSPDKMAFGLYQNNSAFSPQESLPDSETQNQDTGREGGFDQNIALHATIDALRKYRILCEQRILQLCPQHPLPVQEHHLTQMFQSKGSAMSSARSGTARDNVSEGSTEGNTLVLRQHIDTIMYEKAQLERALREETLANEEQRNLIQILKNVIEQKLQRDGLLDLLRQTIETRKRQEQYNTFGSHQKSDSDHPEDPISLYVVLADLKFNLEQKTRENLRLIDQVKSLDATYQRMTHESNQSRTRQSNMEKQLKFYQEQTSFLSNNQRELADRNEELMAAVESQNEQLDHLRNEVMLAKNHGLDPDQTNNTLLQQMISATGARSGKSSTIEKVPNDERLFGTQSVHNVSSAVSNYDGESVKNFGDRDRRIAKLEDESDLAHTQLQVLQDRLIQKDQDIRQLRDQVERVGQDLFTREQENDQLQFANSQLEKRLEMLSSLGKRRELERSRQIEEQSSLFIEEYSHAQEVEGRYEKTIKHCQKELKQTKDFLSDQAFEMEQTKQEIERLSAELELRQAQIDSLKRNGQKDREEIKDLRHKLDDAGMQVTELTQDKLRRQDRIAQDAEKRDQLYKEKAELQTQNSELMHQLEILRTQSQTAGVKSEQQVKDASIKADTMERMQKQKAAELEVLTKELTQTACALKSAEAQVQYLEKSNEQMMADLRQAKVDNDALERERVKQATQISDLVEENEQLYRNEERARRMNEELQNIRLKHKTSETEIQDLDRRLRNAFEAKEAQDLEISKLKREVQSLESDKVTLIKQKETLSCQARDSERRIYEYVKQNQDSEEKIRKNAILIKDLVTERDKFKALTEDKEREIGDLSNDIKATRHRCTDLTLIEEKSLHFIEETEQVIDANKKSLHDYLRNFLRTVQNSDALCQKLTMRRRDKGHQIQDKMHQRPKERDEPDVWCRMIAVKDTQNLFGDAFAFLMEMVDIFLQSFVELNSDFSKKEKQVNQLENKLGSIHSVDLHAQETIMQLKEELADIRKQYANMEADKNQEIQVMQETLKLVQSKNIELQRAQGQTEKKLQQTIAEMPFQNRRQEQELMLANQHLKYEKKRLQDLIVKIQAFLRGVPAEQIIEQMTSCSLQVAKAMTDRDSLVNELHTVESKLAQAMMENPCSAPDSKKVSAFSSPGLILTQSSLGNLGSVTSPTDGNKFKHLRQAVLQKEALIQEADDRISFLQGKLNSLESQLHDQRKGDTDIFPNRDNPFKETKESNNTHSLQMLLRETKDLRKKLNERNSSIMTLENELKKIKTLTGDQLNEYRTQAESPIRQDHFEI